MAKPAFCPLDQNLPSQHSSLGIALSTDGDSYHSASQAASGPPLNWSLPSLAGNQEKEESMQCLSGINRTAFVHYCYSGPCYPAFPMTEPMSFDFWRMHRILLHTESEHNF